MKTDSSLSLCWHDQPLATPLRRDEVHVWLLNLDAPQPWNERLLDSDERERAARFKVSLDRLQFIRRRILARQLLAGILGISPEGIAWNVGPRGRISLAFGDLDFNWSHSGNLFLFGAATTGHVGVDIERWRDDLDLLALAESALPPKEADRLRSLPTESRAAPFWTAWTAHEAAAKASGTGIVEPANSSDSTWHIAHRTAHGVWTAAVAWRSSRGSAAVSR